jgi:hypothetical protein
MKHNLIGLSISFLLAFNLCAHADQYRATPVTIAAQAEAFIKVDGPDLRSRMEKANSMAGAASLPSFWMGYAFDPRPNIEFDAQEVNAPWDPSIKGPSISLNVVNGSRNVGVFLLYDAGAKAITQVEIYNLDRPHDFGGRRVYWLQQARAQESLNLLKGLAEPSLTGNLAEKSIIGIGLHNDPGAADILQEVARKATDYQIRHWAICWLGQAQGQMGFLADLALDQKEPYKVRWKALDAIQHSLDPMAATTLQRIYQTTSDARLRKIVLAVAFLNLVNPNLDDAVRFLADVASHDPSAASREQALNSLDKMNGQHVPKALIELVQATDVETAIQQRALNAIGNGPKDEAVPLLIEVAKAHPKAELRRQAITRLGSIRDPRVVEFLQERLKQP